MARRKVTLQEEQEEWIRVRRKLQSAEERLELQCKYLQVLPDDFPLQLTEVSLLGCLQLQQLPKSFARLSNLQTLEIDCCHNLTCLPDPLGNWNLRVLEIRNCRRLSNLSSVGELKSLESLCLHDSPLIEHLQTDSNLQRLVLHNLPSLRSTHLECKTLQVLSIRNCQHICRWNLGTMKELRMLRIMNPIQPLELFELADLKNLRVLRISLQQDLSELPAGLDQLSKLHHLQLKWWGPVHWDSIESAALPPQLCRIDTMDGLGDWLARDLDVAARFLARHPFLYSVGYRQAPKSLQPLLNSNEFGPILPGGSMAPVPDKEFVTVVDKINARLQEDAIGNATAIYNLLQSQPPLFH